MERFTIANTTEAMVFEIRILGEASFVGATGLKRVVQRSHIVIVRFVTRNYADIPIRSVWEKFNGNNAGLRSIVRQQNIKIHTLTPHDCFGRSY
jgi:hypothetical protein